MGTCVTFDHTADLGLRITAADADDLFRTAAEGLLEAIVANRNAVRPLVTEPVALRAETTAELLVAWLNELIYRVETEHRLYTRFDIHLSADGRALDGTIAGEPIDRDRHLLEHEVKAVTHHALRLEHDGSGWTAEVILDI